MTGGTASLLLSCCCCCYSQLTTTVLDLVALQGFELATPSSVLTEGDGGRAGNESYFSEFGGFRSLHKAK
jgi:hypothetical protein